MTRIDALKELKEKVEAGGDVYGFGAVGDPLLRGYAEGAYRGSLNAAKALHEAVLPGWGWLVNGYRGYASVWIPEDDSPFPDGFQGIHPYPARAWLLAILSALIAQEEQA